MQQHAFLLTATVVGMLGLTPHLASQDITQETASQFERHVTVAWQGQRLGAVLARLSETQEISIWLDRRVDPHQRVEASFTDLPLYDVLEQLARKLSLGMSVLDNMIYVGPVQSAHELATLLKRAQDSVANAQPSIRRVWLEEKPATWPRLSQPRDLLKSMLDQAGITLENSQAIAHDLWTPKQLPSLSLVDKTVLILVGFDLTCQISKEAGACQVVPIERPVVLKREYRIPKNRKRVLTKIQLLVPQSSVKLQGRTLHVTGRWEDQLKVQQTLAGKPPKSSRIASAPRTSTEKLFSLRLKNQAVGGVINQLARQLKLQVEWDRQSLDQANRSQQTLVSCDMKNVSLDELLSGILTPAGLKFQRSGENIKITSAP